MTFNQYLLAIDQGTTSSRAIVFKPNSGPISHHQIDLNQSYPQPGWVEQDPNEIWEKTLLCCQYAMKKIHLSANDIAAIGISNQRETTLLWDRVTGKPIWPAIVWQDRRTASLCISLAKHPIHTVIHEKTGLLLDPYFSATKIMWLLDTVPGARERAEKGELAFGTIDTFLLWKLTGGKSHATDATNASRTLLFNIKTQTWDQDILSAFNIPASLLPIVLDNSALFGETDPHLFRNSIPITGMAGDQQAAMIGQACFQSGMATSTYGTGCFMLLNTGQELIQSKHQLLGTIVYRLQGETVYGLEGSIFSAGITIKWLRDNLKFIHTASETEKLAHSVLDTEGIYLVPGFTGLGAPYWDPDARGAILGLTCNSRIEHIVRAALESVCYQSRDLLEAMQNDSGMHLELLRVDGAMVANNWLLQFLADILMLDVQRPFCIESSALGASYLAGLYVGIYSSIDDISKNWCAEATFTPGLLAKKSESLYSGWKRAVARVLTK